METSLQSPHWTIPGDQFVLLSEALKVDRGPLQVTKEQRELIRRVCTYPAARAVPPEQFFASCKQCLNIAATNLNIPLGRERDDLLSRLFSVCVEEFFQGDCGTDIQPLKDRVKRSLRRRVIGSDGRPRDEDCRGAR